MEQHAIRLFDSHCHLDDRAYDGDRAETLDRMRAAGVAAAMVVGIHRRSSEQALDLARHHPNLFASVGVHPHDVKRCDDPTIKALVRLADDPNVRAWGETGLDFNRMFSPQADQEHWFRRQIGIAVERDLPLIIHERDSGGRLLDILREEQLPDRRGVVHCFSGTRDELRGYLDLGFAIGITGVVTIQSRGAGLRRLVPEIPDDRLLVETDAPYLTPAPEKNKTRRNEPAFVRSVLLKLAEVRNQPPDALAETVWQNTCRLFGIPEDLASG
jgi:TatD DNase family protein